MADRNQSFNEVKVPFMERYSKTITGVVAGILVLVALYMVYSYLYKQPLEKEAAESLFQAQAQFERDSFALALTNPGSGYQGFLDISDRYSSTKAGNLANYYAGISYLHLGEYEAALDHLKDFSPTGDITPTMKQGAMGDAYSELDNYDEAIKRYKRAASFKNEYLAPFYLLKKGRLEMALERYDASLKTFQELKADYPQSTFASSAEKYISMVK